MTNPDPNPNPIGRQGLTPQPTNVFSVFIVFVSCTRKIVGILRFRDALIPWLQFLGPLPVAMESVLTLDETE